MHVNFVKNVKNSHRIGFLLGHNSLGLSKAQLIHFKCLVNYTNTYDTQAK